MSERSAVVTANSTQTTFTATFEGLTELQRYSYQIRGFSEDGPGNFSTTETLTLGMCHTNVCSLECCDSVCVCTCAVVRVCFRSSCTIIVNVICV